MKLLFFFCTLMIAIHAKDQPAWNADAYVKNNSNQFNHAIKELHKLELKEHDSVIEFGCRTGDLMAYISKYYIPKGSIHGIDSTATFITKAITSYASIKNISFEQADLLTFKSTKLYDKALSFWTLHWMEDYETALQQIMAALKPGGRALIAHIVDHGTRFSEQIIKHMHMSPWNTYCQHYTFPAHIPSLETVLSAIRNNSLKILHLEMKENSDYYKDTTALQNAYQAIPFVSCIPQEKQDQFFKEIIISALREEPVMADGTIHDHAPVVVMVLEK